MTSKKQNTPKHIPADVDHRERAVILAALGALDSAARHVILAHVLRCLLAEHGTWRAVALVTGLPESRIRRIRDDLTWNERLARPYRVINGR